jgi:glycosyltransferase involved in cell wall biosynthesis
MGFGRAGGYRVLSNFSNYFINSGHTVKFITPSYSASPYYPTNAEIIKANVTFGSIPVIRVFFAFIALFRVMKHINGDVIIANHYITAYLAFFAPKFFKKFYYVQAYEAKLVTNFFLKFLAHCSYLLPILKIVNSEEILPRKIKRVVGVVPAGIDLDLFRAREYVRDRRPNNLSIQIGCIGRIEKYKGTSEIISAFQKVLSQSDVFLNIAVHMPKISPILENNVAFYEINNDESLADFYRKNDIFVATGLVEDGAFHYPCAESMACNCVVISNYAPLTNRIDTFNTSLRLHEVNSEKIEQAIKYALQMKNEDIDREVKINSDLMSAYSWEVVSKKFIDILCSNCIDKTLRS